jgi:hypothetical protein
LNQNNVPIVDHRADGTALTPYRGGMPLYRFHIQFGKMSNSPGRRIDLLDDRAAWIEASGICRDLSRDIVEDFGATPSWQLEVSDPSGKPIFKFRFLVETL